MAIIHYYYQYGFVELNDCHCDTHKVNERVNQRSADLI